MSEPQGRAYLERIIEVLIHLIQSGPTTSKTIAEMFGFWQIRAHLMMGNLRALNLVEGCRELHGPGTPDPQWVWRITDDGRRLLKGFDEYDARAPFAAFENR